MATVGSLVAVTANHLRYLVTSTDATTLVITSSGAASPDLVTDTAGQDGLLRAMVKAFTNGYGKIAAGALTQAQARALWLDDNTGANIGNAQVARASITITGRAAATGLLPTIDANVDGSGRPTLTATPPAGNSTFYIDITAPGAVGAI